MGALFVALFAALFAALEVARTVGAITAPTEKEPSMPHGMSATVETPIVGFIDEPAQSPPKGTWAWVPALTIATWVEFVYVVPVASHWLTRLFS